MKHDWTDGTKKCWSRLFVYAIMLLVLTRGLTILFRNLYFKQHFLRSDITFSINSVIEKYMFFIKGIFDQNAGMRDCSNAFWKPCSIELTS